MNDKRREQALAVYCEHNTGNANANYYEMRDSAVASMLAFACDQMTEKDAEIAQLRDEARRKNKQTQEYLGEWDAVIDDLKCAVSCINPLEDLKRAILALQERAEKAEAALAERDAEIARLREELKQYLNEATK